MRIFRGPFQLSAQNTIYRLDVTQLLRHKCPSWPRFLHKACVTALRRTLRLRQRPRRGGRMAMAKQTSAVGSKGSHRTSTTDSVVFAIIVQGPTNSCCRAADIPRQPPRLFCGAPLRPPQRRATPAFTTISGYDGRMQAGSQKPAQVGLQESCGEKAEIYHQ